MPLRRRLEDVKQERIRKSLWLSGMVSFFFLFLLARLVFIQVIDAETNIRLSKQNQMRLKPLKAPRGRVFDRNGKVFARNRPSYSIGVFPDRMKDRSRVVNNLLRIRDTSGMPVFDSLELIQRIEKAQYRRFDLTRLKEDVPIEIVSIIEEHSMQIPGIVVETEARREYTLGPDAFHVLGYMSEIPDEQFDSLKKKGYLYGDLIGKSGLEREYENVFKGKNGHEYIEVNAYGKSLGPIKSMPRAEPTAGNDVYLTLDMQLQQAAAKAFPDSLKGAIVALDPRNGEVLIMYSNPSIDPNIFSMATSVRTKNWAEAALNSDLPFNNRATSGTYTPGSTFKLISGIAALAEHKIRANEYMPVACHGAYRIGRRVAHCWKLSGHGPLDLRGAIRQSCNVYFYQLGLRVGDDIINKYAEMFGLGHYTGIDLPSERNGWLSGEEAYNQRFAKRGWKWTRGLVLDLAIGQTQIVTPIQLAQMVGGLGNGRVINKPHLLKEIRSRDGTVLEQNTPVVTHSLDLEPKLIETIRTAMEDVIKPGGTGGWSRVPGIPVGGKTGSAENPHGEKTHALFVACAPVDNPVIAISVVVENAGHGGSVAAPIAGEVLRYFFAETEDGKELVKEYEMKGYKN
ncbi:MAG: penicillin-binding protein 2 [Fibrobacterota bacterium]